MLSRRELIGKAAVGAGVAALTIGAGRTAVASTGTGDVQPVPGMVPNLSGTLPSNPSAKLPSDPSVVLPSDPSALLPGDPSGILPSHPSAKLPSDPSAKLPTDPSVVLPENRGVQEPVAPADAAAAPPPWALVRPLVAGSMIAHGWRLADVGPVRDGSCVVTLRNERGRSHRIHLCRNDGDPQGLVYTRRVDLVVMNEGQGDLATEEQLAQAVAELAHRIAANEPWVPGRIFTDLLPHGERLRRFASAGNPWADGKLR
jgi:hypothetical protein